MFQLSFLTLKISKYCLCLDIGSECSIKNNNPKMDDQDAAETEDAEGSDDEISEDSNEDLLCPVQREFEGSLTVHRNKKMIILDHLLKYKKISAKKFNGSENQWNQVEQRLIKRQMMIYEQIEKYEKDLEDQLDYGDYRQEITETFIPYFKNLMLCNCKLKYAKESNNPVLEKMLEKYKDSKKIVNSILQSKAFKCRRTHPIYEANKYLSEFLDLSVCDLKFIVDKDDPSEYVITERGMRLIIN